MVPAAGVGKSPKHRDNLPSAALPGVPMPPRKQSDENNPERAICGPTPVITHQMPKGVPSGFDLGLPPTLGQCLQVLVRDNNIDQALKVLKKRLQREGVFREMKLRTKSGLERPIEDVAMAGGAPGSADAEIDQGVLGSGAIIG